MKGWWNGKKKPAKGRKGETIALFILVPLSADKNFDVPLPRSLARSLFLASKLVGIAPQDGGRTRAAGTKGVKNLERLGGSRVLKICVGLHKLVS